MARKKPLSKLEKLTAKWYKKLADETNFVDIETLEGELKRPGLNNHAYYTTIGWEAKVSYYTMAEYFLNDYKFDSNINRVMWEYHANGLSYREIAKLLKELKLTKKISYVTVAHVIKKLRNSMYAMYVFTEAEANE